jgi:hypothetical protein
MDALLHGAQYRRDHELCDGIELREEGSRLNDLKLWS